MKMRWLLFPPIVIVAVWLGLSWHHRSSSVRPAEPALTVMSYNVGDDHHPNPTSTQIATVIQRAGVPDLLLLQDNADAAVIAQLAQQLGFPYHLSGRETTPAVNASLLSRYPLSGSQTLLFENDGVMPGMICADVWVRTATFLACSLYMPSLSGTARKVVGEHDHEYRDVIHLLWNEAFRENARSRDVARVIGWLGKRATGTVIMGGDFNTFPQSRAIRAMGQHFEDVLWLTADSLTGTYIKLNFPLRPRIDYLFHSEDIRAVEAAVVRDSAGDHYPVRARMLLPGTASKATSR